MALRRPQIKARKGLVIDANILIRAVFGQRVRQILETYEDHVNFCAPDIYFQEAQKYVSLLAARRKFEASAALTVLAEIGRIVQPVNRSLYEDYEEMARQRKVARG